MSFYQLQSIKNSESCSEHDSYTTDAGGYPLEVVYDYGHIKKGLNMHHFKKTPPSHVKYVDFFPIIDRSQIITKQEGGTPLYQLKRLGEQLGLEHLYVKAESANPTGVFKDRGTMIEITKALELGASAVCVASTGNMAASVSAYAAQAGLPCYVLVPEGTPVGKLAQTIAYGARVVQIKGTYDTCILLARYIAKEYHFFLCGDYAFRREGQKSIAYEIVEQLDWQSPDIVICPIGYGTNLAGIYKGFVEFKRFGLTPRIPTFIGVQAAGCSPIADAWERGETSYIPVEKPNTIASAVAACDPCDAPFIFSALLETKGRALKYTDTEMLDAQKVLGRTEGLFVEPSSALPLAVLLSSALQREQSLQSKRIVLIATGNGLKDPNAILRTVEQPPTVEGNEEAVGRLVKKLL